MRLYINVKQIVKDFKLTTSKIKPRKAKRNSRVSLH